MKKFMDEIMTPVRNCRGKLIKHYTTLNDSLASIDPDVYTSTQCEKMRQGFKLDYYSRMNSDKATALADIKLAVADYQKSAALFATKAPSTDHVNLLNVLSFRVEHGGVILPTEMSLYAGLFGGCPSEMMALGALAKELGMSFPVYDPLSLLRGVEAMRQNLEAYLTAFRGNPDTFELGGDSELGLIQRATEIRTLTELDRFFDPDSEFKTPEEAAQAFWTYCFGAGDPSILNGGSGINPVTVKHHFTDIDAMTAFIQEQEAQTAPSEKGKIVEMILADCPDEYVEKYNHFLETGEMLPLNVE